MNESRHGIKSCRFKRGVFIDEKRNIYFNFLLSALSDILWESREPRVSVNYAVINVQRLSYIIHKWLAVIVFQWIILSIRISKKRESWCQENFLIRWKMLRDDLLSFFQVNEYWFQIVNCIIWITWSCLDHPSSVFRHDFKWNITRILCLFF